MFIQVTDRELVDSGLHHMQATPVIADYETEPLDDNANRSFMRGLVTACLISLPFWLLVCFTMYLLI